MKPTLQTSVIGSYPVCLDTMEFMNTYYAQQEISWHRYIEQAVREMIAAGVCLVSDGQTRDPFIQLFTRGLKGCRIRQRTEIIAPVRYQEPITIADQVFARQLLIPSSGLVGVLTGPFTLMKSCVDLFYHDEKQLCFDFAAALRKEAEQLQKHVDLISIDEPFFSNELPEYAGDLISVITKNLSCPTRLHACGDVSKIISNLVDMPVDILSHEFKASPHLINTFKDYPCSKKICVGAVRSDDLRVESVDEILTHMKNAFDVFGDNVVQMAPDCGQRLLPRDVAFLKLQHLVAAGDILNGR